MSEPPLIKIPSNDNADRPVMNTRGTVPVFILGLFLWLLIVLSAISIYQRDNYLPLACLLSILLVAMIWVRLISHHLIFYSPRRRNFVDQLALILAVFCAIGVLYFWYYG